MLKRTWIQSQILTWAFRSIIRSLAYSTILQKILVVVPTANFFNVDFRAMLSGSVSVSMRRIKIWMWNMSMHSSVLMSISINMAIPAFRHEHLYPMWRLWSCPVEQGGQIPYKFIGEFFPASSHVAELKTVLYGLRSRVDLLATFVPFRPNDITFRKTAVHQVSRSANDVLIETTQGTERFDWVRLPAMLMIAELLKDPSAQSWTYSVGKFRYQDNRMVGTFDTLSCPNPVANGPAGMYM